MRILLIEDEFRLAEALVQILKNQNYLVDMTGDGLEGQSLAESGIYDVIILDRMLPNKEGVEILRSLRLLKIKTPVIFLTAKDSVANRVEGLDAGADDYLVKPFSKDELLARVRALVRRPLEIQEGRNLTLGNLHLDMSNCVALANGEPIKLTLKEAQLLDMLMRNPKQVLPKEQILDRVWGFDKDVELSSVELYIFYLRKKINFSECCLTLSTIRGIGYCLKEK